MVNFPWRQLPLGDEVFFDHVAWMVPDMEAASAAFTRLGFPLTPFSPHTAADPNGGPPIQQGTANRLAMLEIGYLEILCARDGIDDPLSRNVRSSLERYTGVHLVASAVADAEAHHARLSAQGVEPLPLVGLRRVIEAEDGSDVEVSFSVVRPPLNANPEGRMQLLTHYTPKHMWQGRYIARDNAITALTGAVIVVDDPAEAGTRLSELFTVPVRTEGDERVLDFDRGQLRLTSQAGLNTLLPGLIPPVSPYIAALTMASRDLEATWTFMAERGVKILADTDTMLAIDPSESMGTALVIFQNGGP
jgi:hypothetical protein